MEALLGSSLGVFVGLCVVLFGFAAFMTGQAIALTWRPLWHLAPYALLLAAAERFLAWALFGADLASLSGFAVAAAVLFLVALVAFRLTRAGQMVVQYPWLYERVGLFAWRERAGD